METKTSIQDYGVGNLIYDGHFYDQGNAFSFDIPFFEKWAKAAKGPSLELCCGTGRITIPLAQAGIDITGVDFTPSMLNRAMIKAKKLDLDINFIEADMRAFDLNKKFDLVFIPFNSLQNTYLLEDIERTFACVKDHLKKNGRFLLDVFNPSIELMVERKGKTYEVQRFLAEDGQEVVITEQMEYEAATQINRVKWTHQIGGEEVIEKLDMRCFFPQEMQALLKYNGFEVEHLFGNYDESAFTSESPKQLFVCKAR